MPIWRTMRQHATTLACRIAALLDAHLIGAAATGISRFAPSGRGSRHLAADGRAHDADER
jgi:hypothetical protein